MIAVCAHQWYALPPILGSWWEIRGKLTCPNGTSPHTWGTILCIIPLHIPYKYPISPCCGECVTRRYGHLDVTIMTKCPSLGEDSDSNPPPFPDICPRYARFGISLTGALYDNYTVYWQCGEEITKSSDWVARGWLVCIQDFVCYLCQKLVTLFCRSNSLSLLPLWSGYRTDLPGWCFLYWYWESTCGLQIHCQP